MSSNLIKRFAEAVNDPLENRKAILAEMSNSPLFNEAEFLNLLHTISSISKISKISLHLQLNENKTFQTFVRYIEAGQELDSEIKTKKAVNLFQNYYNNIFKQLIPTLKTAIYNDYYFENIVYINFNTPDDYKYKPTSESLVSLNNRKFYLKAEQRYIETNKIIELLFSPSGNRETSATIYKPLRESINNAFPNIKHIRVSIDMKQDLTYSILVAFNPKDSSDGESITDFVRAHLTELIDNILGGVSGILFDPLYIEDYFSYYNVSIFK